MNFEILGGITSVRTIAIGRSVRESKRLRKFYGGRRWKKLKVLPPSGFLMVRYTWLNCIGMKHTASARKKLRSNGSSPKKRVQGVSQYAICVKNEDYPASLELRKIYRVVSDKESSALGLVRIIDESGEDYLYPAEYFVPIKLPRAAERAMQIAS